MRFTRSIFAFLFVIAVCVCAGAPARGQGDDMARAKEAYSRGQELFDSGEYEKARESFQDSFDAFPHYRTIFNLALCDEKLEDIPSAVEHYSRYVNWSEEVPNRDDVLKKIEELKALLPPEPEVVPDPDLEVDPEEDPEEKPVDVGPTTVEPGPDLRVPGWVTLSTGAAAVVVGGVMLGMAQRKRGEMESVDGVPYDSKKHDEIIDDGERYEKVGWVVGGIGAAAVAAGLVLLIVSDHPEEDGEKPVTVGLDVRANGGAVYAGWSF